MSEHLSNFPNPEKLKKVFPPEKASDAFILGIIAIHGNEPQIMTAAIGADVNAILGENELPGAAIVLPSIYGERTRDILREDFPDQEGNIYLSDGMGEILKRTEFSRAGYQAHMREVAAHQPKVRDALLEYLSRPFLATSLDGKTREFQPDGKRLEINAGANVTASLPGEKTTHFIFPVLLSEMIDATLADPQISNYFDHKTLEEARKIAADFESTYKTTQIPYVHTLYGQEGYDTTGKILTPPLKKGRPVPQLDLPDDNGIYIMASGSEIGKEIVEDQALQLQKQGHEILFPPWLKLPFGKAALPDSVFHPGVKFVMGRMGWGIGWQSQVAGKPFVAMPHLWFDNPEIHFNLTALKESGLGMVFQAGDDLAEKAQTLTPRIREMNTKIAYELGIPQNMDGIRFAAEQILKSETSII